MYIDNNFSVNSVSNNINFSTIKKNSEAPKLYKNISQMPDIRYSDLLIPVKKIYLPKNAINATQTKSSFPQFPDEHLIVPKDKENPLTSNVRKMYKNADVIQYKNLQTGKNIIRISDSIFSDDGVLDSLEVTEVVIGKSNKAAKYIKDYEHNSETEIHISNPFKSRQKVNESVTTIHKDSNNNITKIEEYKMSDIKGVYNIVETDSLGNKTIVSNAVKNPDGSYYIEKNLVSLDGTTTKYFFQSDEKEHHKRMFSQITSPDGKVLSTIDRTYDKEDENVTYSSVNGHKFKAEKTKDGIAITNFTTNEKTEIKNTDFTAKEETKMLVKTLGAKGQFSSENVTDILFDTLPADTLLTLKENIKQILPLENDLDSAFVGIFDILMCKTDNFVINHELGHSMDSPRIKDDENILNLAKNRKNVIADKEQFRKSYVEEKAAFIKEFPDFGEKFIGYFISSPKNKSARGRKETVAESNAINGLQPSEPEILAMRTILLQRYFPRTIAELTKLMNPIAYADSVA